MSEQKRILFAGEAVCFAHVVRPLALARGLKAQRPEFDIHFACGERYLSLTRGSGIQTHTIPTTDNETIFKNLNANRPGYDIKTLQRYIEAEQALIQNLNPDIVIGDNRLSLSISCRLENVPYINLVNAYWSPYYTLGFPVPDLAVTRFLGNQISRMLMPIALPISFRKQAEPYNQLCRQNGLPPIGSLKDVFTSGDQVLYVDIPELSPTRERPGHHNYSGPVLWEPDVELPESIMECPPDQKQVYVTMGSSGDTAMTATTVSVCRSLGYRVVVSSTDQEDDWNNDPDVIAAPLLPGMAVMQHCDLMICHGGSGTVYQALSQGIPVLGICANADQQMVMQGVTGVGAGASMKTHVRLTRFESKMPLKH